MRTRSAVRYFVERLAVYKNLPTGRVIFAAYAIGATIVVAYLLVADVAFILFDADIFPSTTAGWPSEAFNCILILILPRHTISIVRSIKRKLAEFADALHAFTAQ